MAEPGEFTLRAFLSGRIDLAQSEAVLQVIEARTSTDLESALQKLAGGLTTPLRKLRDRLLDRLVELEAYLDFVEEADVPVVLREALAAEMSEAARTLDALIATFKDRDASETRPRVVLIGHPNAGKSKLFNALIGTDQAIVSPIAGTTRDYLIGHCDCDGIPIALIDTAGLEIAANTIMGSAQSHRSHQIAEADLVLNCTPIDESLIEHTFDQPCLNIFTKSDLLSEPSINASPLVTSAVNGHGLDALKQKIASTLRSIRSRSETSSSVGSQWHDSLLRASAALRHSLEVAGYSGSEELIAAELRQVLEDLGKIVGAVVTEDILDQIFRRFCIGK
jgi:tRNA modification GTPase